VRYAHLPANTIQVKGEAVCASLRGLPISPCFSLQKTSESSFRGAISGLGFAACNFTRHITHAEAGEEARPVRIVRRVNANTEASQPLGLRPSLAGSE
jgi:hypothetical protein